MWPFSALRPIKRCGSRWNSKLLPSTDKGVSQSCSPPAVLLDLITSIQNLSQWVDYKPRSGGVALTEGQIRAAFSRCALFLRCASAKRLIILCRLSSVRHQFANLQMTQAAHAAIGPWTFAVHICALNEMRDLDACPLKVRGRDNLHSRGCKSDWFTGDLKVAKTAMRSYCYLISLVI